MAFHNRVGKWGERIAEEYFVKEGYSIAERNWRLGHLEVDLIVMKDNYIVFVEVKTRSDKDYDPVSAVDRRKMSLICRAAHTYMISKKLPHFTRFDIFAIIGDEHNYTIEHLPDAFFPTLRTYGRRR